MKHTFANIIIDISHEKVDRTFQYIIPEQLKSLVRAGVQVEIPFGKGNSIRRGFVVEVTDTPEFDISRMKEIAGVSADRLSVQSQLIELAWEMKRLYGATMNQTLKTVLPVKQKIKAREKRTIRCLLSEEELLRALSEARKKSYRARIRLYEAFLEEPEIPAQVLENQLNITASSLKPLIEKGMVEVVREEISRNPVEGEGTSSNILPLNEEQKRAVEEFWGSYRERHGDCQAPSEGREKTWLLYGITGSGKTEVYMEMLSRVLAMGRQAIVLIPEIALTYQTVMRFYRRFGSRISIINSRLSQGERYDQWERAMKGEVDIMIGPRSALFTPFSNLGLIIIDEEHEGAYKSETMPRYHAREVAGLRARLCGADVVLGSATPSVESFTRALQGEYGLLRLTRRAAENSRLPQVETVDLREELKAGNKTMFSRRLTELMEDRLGRGEQMMLFMNRRGYSSFVSCRSCGEAVKCPHCDVSLTFHNNGRLCCHYCGYSVPMPEKCPSCGSPYIAGFGTGTQKLEEMTKRLFPGAKVLRMDADTTSKKGGHEEILSAFAGGEADILIGTQMIVKGHDFRNVTLVGIMAADLSLNTPDYRCAERTFQLLVQAAGRAGRGERGGNVVIQTYSPDHYSIEAAARQDYEAFYRREIAYRRMMNYPPVCRMSAVLFAARDEALLEAFTEAALSRAEELLSRRRVPFQLIGPVNAPVYKVNDIYRKILYIKSQSYDIMAAERHYICAEPPAPEGSLNTPAASAHPSERCISGGYDIMAAERHYICAEPPAPEGSLNTPAASAHPSERYISGGYDGMDVCGQRPSEPVYGEIGGIRECMDSLQKSNPRFSSVSVQYDVW